MYELSGKSTIWYVFFFSSGVAQVVSDPLPSVTFLCDIDVPPGRVLVEPFVTEDNTFTFADSSTFLNNMLPRGPNGSIIITQISTGPLVVSVTISDNLMRVLNVDSSPLEVVCLLGDGTRVVAGSYGKSVIPYCGCML